MPCADGYWQAENEFAGLACKRHTISACPAGTKLTAGSTSADDRACIPCPNGQFHAALLDPGYSPSGTGFGIGSAQFRLQGLDADTGWQTWLEGVYTEDPSKVVGGKSVYRLTNPASDDSGVSPECQACLDYTKPGGGTTVDEDVQNSDGSCKYYIASGGSGLCVADADSESTTLVDCRKCAFNAIQKGPREGVVYWCTTTAQSSSPGQYFAVSWDMEDEWEYQLSKGFCYSSISSRLRGNADLLSAEYWLENCPGDDDCRNDNVTVEVLHAGTECFAYSRPSCGAGEKVLAVGSASTDQTCTPCAETHYQDAVSHTEQACKACTPQNGCAAHVPSCSTVAVGKQKCTNPEPGFYLVGNEDVAAACSSMHTVISVEQCNACSGTAATDCLIGVCALGYEKFDARTGTCASTTTATSTTTSITTTTATSTTTVSTTTTTTATATSATETTSTTVTTTTSTATASVTSSATVATEGIGVTNAAANQGRSIAVTVSGTVFLLVVIIGVAVIFYRERQLEDQADHRVGVDVINDGNSTTSTTAANALSLNPNLTVNPNRRSGSPHFYPAPKSNLG